MIYNIDFCECVFHSFPAPDKGNDCEFVMGLNSLLLDKIEKSATEKSPNETVLRFVKENLLSHLKNLYSLKQKLLNDDFSQSVVENITAERKRYVREYMLFITTLYIQNHSDLKDFEYVYKKAIPIISSQNLELDGYGKGYEKLKNILAKRIADSLLEKLKEKCKEKHNLDELAEIIIAL